MIKLEINIPQEMINYLQKLNYEIVTREEIITKLLEMHQDDIDDSLFTSKPVIKYSEELSRVKAEYELAKIEVEKLYVPDMLYGKHEYKWEIDFVTNVMTVYVFCPCGIEVVVAEQVRSKNEEVKKS
jgi:hypothetical protein